MLPFGQNLSFNVTQQNLFGARVMPVAGIPMPMIVTTNASLITSTSMPHCFASSQAMQPQPMIIASDVLNTIPRPVSETAGVTSSPTVSLIEKTEGSNVDQWTEHKTSDGRVFYYNRTKNISSWTKPDEMKTPQELWRTYKTTEGKEYYYNVQTKETTWHKPSVLLASEEKLNLNKLTEITKTKKDDNSEMERAMAATLKKLEGGTGTDSLQKATTSKKLIPVDDTDNKSDDVKRRQIEKFKELIKDKYDAGRINTGMSWEQTMKYIQQDFRFRVLPKVSEKKQVFNAWKAQRAKEERDERRIAIKKSKEDLEKWLLSHPKMRPTLRYLKADQLFANEAPWRNVSETERREIFLDMQSIIAEREEKAKKELKERNIKALADILDGIEEVNHKTTWAQAQRILIENLDFANDTVLQGMDKEDALIVFHDHIRAAEKLYLKEKQLEVKRIRRQERKIREAFMQFLHELNSKGILISTSTWSTLYPTISTDERFDAMLMQTGSTALDLFKFYVEDLKNRYYEDRRLIREILENLKVQISTCTTFEQLQQWILSDPRGKNVDIGNMKLCFNSFFEKALTKEKEFEREQQRKQKRQELAFRNLLRTFSPAVEPETEWQDVRDRLKNEEAFTTIESEELREQYFKEYIKSISEACGHYHSSKSLNEKFKKKKKEKRKKRKNEQGEIIERTSSTFTATIKNISEDSEDMLSDVSATELEKERSAILQKLTTDIK